jgi:hypothetical protein
VADINEGEHLAEKEMQLGAVVGLSLDKIES